MGTTNAICKLWHFGIKDLGLFDLSSELPDNQDRSCQQPPVVSASCSGRDRPAGCRSHSGPTPSANPATTCSWWPGSWPLGLHSWVEPSLMSGSSTPTHTTSSSRSRELPSMMMLNRLDTVCEFKKIFKMKSVERQAVSSLVYHSTIY